MRVSLNAATTPDALKTLANNKQVDGFGRAALVDPRVNQKHIRGVKLHDTWMTQDGRLVEIVEQAPDAWHNMRPRYGNQMTQGQMLAFEAGHRALNDAGYAWGDNHAGNFTFEAVPGGPDRWRLVVIDPGGIMPAAGATAAERAANARIIQGAVNNPANAYFTQMSQARTLGHGIDDLTNRMVHAERILDRVDFTQWNLPEGNFPFTIRTVLEHPSIRGFHSLNPTQFSQLYAAHYGGN